MFKKVAELYTENQQDDAIIIELFKDSQYEICLEANYGPDGSKYIIMQNC